MSVLACWRAAAGFKGEALSSGRACRDVEQGVSTSERAEASYIRGLHPQCQAGQGIWISWRVNCKLNYEPEGRSRAAGQILDFQIFRLEKKSDETQRSGAMSRALSTIIDFGRLQTLQGDELSLEPSHLELGVLSKLER